MSKLCGCDYFDYVLEGKEENGFLIEKRECGKCHQVYIEKTKILKDEIKERTEEERKQFELEQKSNTFGT